MAYQKTVWNNDGTPAIDADNLNKIEGGIEACIRRDGDTMEAPLKLCGTYTENDEAVDKRYVDSLFVTGSFTYNGESITIPLNFTPSVVMIMQDNVCTYSDLRDYSLINKFAMATPGHPQTRYYYNSGNRHDFKMLEIGEKSFAIGKSAMDYREGQSYKYIAFR